MDTFKLQMQIQSNLFEKIIEDKNKIANEIIEILNNKTRYKKQEQNKQNKHFPAINNSSTEFINKIDNK